MADASLTKQTPLLSVCIITYNQEAYIAQAIESVLAQKTEFIFDIIIGEDESSDNTRKIVVDYKNRYPNKIKLILNDRSKVIYINGRATGRWNLIQTLAAATGKYIAILEGDDYWTDPLKLQRQVTLLEDYPEYAICAHLVQPTNAHGDNVGNSLTGQVCPQEFSIIHALNEPPVHTSSLVFKNYDLTKHEAYPYLSTLPAADGLIILMLLSYGKGYCFKEVWSAYRLHQDGRWSTRPIYLRYFGLLQIKYVFYTLNPEYLSIRVYVQFFALLAQLLLSVGIAAIKQCSIRPLFEVLSIISKQEIIPGRKLILIASAGLLFVPIRGVVIIFKWLQMQGIINFRRVRDKLQSRFEI